MYTYTPERFGQLSLNEMIITFNGWIDGALKTTPDKVVTKNNVRWWTLELTALRKKVRKARKDFQVVRRNVSNVGDDRLDRTVPKY